MPFGLLNAGATYQRLVNKMFKHQLGKTMEVYMDDMLVKSKEANDHVRHLSDMFQILMEYRVKLNPQKCVFGVDFGKFLGFIVNHRGIEISDVLVREEDGVHIPVYYVSKRLADTETRYTNLEKLAYALIPASRKLRPYFQANKIEVRTSYPLRQVMHKPEASGRIFKWTEVDQGALIIIPGVEESEKGKQNYAQYWSIFMDGASNEEGINGWYQDKGPRTELYLKCAQRIIGIFNKVRLKLIPCGKNEGADELAKLGSRREATLLGVIPLDIQRQPSVPEYEISSTGSGLEPTWMTPILDYIKEGSLPYGKNEARRMRYKAAHFVIYDGILYRRGFSVPLKCIDGVECSYILREVHEGICGNHSGDLIGELPKMRGGVKYAVVVVDYFIKWAEAEHLDTITTKKLREFVYRALVCCYGIPYKLVSDNEKQFDIKEMREFREQLGI
ncbi:uncharacterized protein LOC141690640 [Apium graveolens]|uniref:uncharacterized protein LOC141690640 n=1 Tax=Apium graveolens TaxID=4045 RepID=UPI003D78E85F